MITAHDCMEFAYTCEQLARKEVRPEVRQRLSELARTWNELAGLQGKDVPRTPPR